MYDRLRHHRNKNFRVWGYPLDKAIPQQGVVTITAGADGAIPLMQVRPAYGRLYSLPLAFVASMVVARCIREEMKK